MLKNLFVLLLSVFVLFSMSLNLKAEKELEKATFAGGCFWCMEPPFEKLDGVVEVISGYTGGTEVNPTYKQVCTDKTGHAEAVDAPPAGALQPAVQRAQRPQCARPIAG